MFYVETLSTVCLLPVKIPYCKLNKEGNENEVRYILFVTLYENSGSADICKVRYTTYTYCLFAYWFDMVLSQPLSIFDADTMCLW